MGPGRAKLGLRRKDRFQNTTLTHIDLKDGTSVTRQVEWDDLPGAIVIPSFYEAPILTGAIAPEFPPCDFQIRIVAPAQTIPSDAKRIGVSLTANSKMFARMLAKIGLCITVATLGTQGYKTLVRELILNDSHQHGLVGGFAGANDDASKTDDLHQITLKPNNRMPGEFIIVEIRLFAKFNCPTNYVVVGQWM